MSARRGATDLAGLLLIDKPAGMTSHDVVHRVRRATGERRVGHAGTLDPSATGVLIVLVGPYTRLERYLSGKSKSYDAVITLGAQTDTDDADGVVTARAPVPAALFDPVHADSILQRFVGTSMQAPPVYSAIKVGGQTAHRVARAGGEIDLAERQISVSMAELVAIDSEQHTWTVRFAVSKGTYIRALARDIGHEAGSAAHLSALRRTAIGAITLAETITLDDVEAATDVRALFADPLKALGLPVLRIDDIQARDVADGRPITGNGIAEGKVAVAHDARLLAIYRAENGRLVAETVLGVLA